MDTFVRVTANVTAYGGDVGMLTLTAPGYDVLPDPRTGGDVRLTDEWNAAARKMWSDSHREARRWTVRTTGVVPDVLVDVWEPQKRQALHKHVAVGVATAKKRRAAHVYALALEREWKRRGGGYVDGGGPKWRAKGLIGIRGPAHAGYYLAKYLVKKGDDGRPVVMESAKARSAPPQIVHVARALTTRTGITMRFLRHRRRCWVLGYDPKTGEVYERGRPVSPREPTASPSAPAEPRGP